MQILDPEMILRLGRVEMKARNLVEGFLAGLHRSSFRGFSVEFAEHRSYVPGDDRDKDPVSDVRVVHPLPEKARQDGVVAGYQ